MPTQKNKNRKSPGRPRKSEEPKVDLHGLEKDDLLDIYRNMFLSREIDDEEIRLKGKGQIFFQINGCGHEAINTILGRVLDPKRDWFFPYYRDRALMLQLGLTPTEMIKMATASHDEPAGACLLYTSPSPRDLSTSRMPSSA